MKTLTTLALLLALGAASSPAQLAHPSPYSSSVYPAQTFTAPGTGATIQLNGLTSASTVGSSFATGKISVSGASLTSVTLSVLGSADNGVHFFPLPITAVADPCATPATTVTATGAGQYQFPLAGMTHVRFSIGTLAATSASLVLTATPNDEDADVPCGGSQVVIPTAVEWWKTNEGSGTSLLTQSGSGNTLTLTNGTWTTPAGFSFAVPTYNGSSTFAQGANVTNTNFTGTTPFSISTWVYQTAVPSVSAVVIGDISGGGPTGWEISINPAGQVEVAMSNTYPTNWLTVSSVGTVSLNVAHNIVVTYDGSQQAAGVTIYIDGVPQTNTSITNLLTASIASGTPVIAGDRTGQTWWFTGVIADIRLYTAVLSQAQVTLLVNGGSE